MLQKLAVATVALFALFSTTAVAANAGEDESLVQDSEVSEFAEIVFIAPDSGVALDRLKGLEASAIRGSAGFDGVELDSTSVVYRDPRIGPETLVVMPDYLEAVGLEYSDVQAVTSVKAFEAEVAASAARKTYNFLGYYGTWSTSTGVYIIGSPGYSVYYQWMGNLDANQSGCVRGKGFYWPPYAPSGTFVQTWYGLGCGSSGSGGGTWGNVAASAQVQAQSSIALTLFQGTWSS